jgi:serine/threonine protein kinase
MIGTTVSHYRILERLGQGGMGEVFLSEDLRLHRPVALKFLRQCEVCPEEERARVFREARAASSLNHPNIAVIYDVEESQTSDGPVFLLAMEYVPGKTLAELSSDPALAFDDILHIIEQTAGALAEAHARGVVHRDIKPSNIMVAQGRVKVLDFGLARVDPRLPDDATTWSRDLATTRDGDVVGTPHYMSPEQALGGSARAGDAREVCIRLGRLRSGEPVAAAEPGSLSVAVAGFANITRRAEDDWLGTGLAETVTAALNEVEGLAVWGRERLKESLRRLGAEASELAPTTPSSSGA